MSTDTHRELQRVASALAARLAGQVDQMLDDPRFAAGAEALARLSDPAWRAGLDDLDPREAAWLTEELTRRWATLGEVVLDPVAWVEAAESAGDDAPVRLTAHADGLEPGWTVAWNGAVPDDGDPAVATWSRPAPVTVRVMGRGPVGRVILTASWADRADAGTGGT